MSGGAQPVKLSLRKRTIYAAIAVGVFFIGLELLLWAAGVKSVIQREDPSRGFSGLVSVFEKAGDTYRTRRLGEAGPFNDQSFLAQKPASGLRIFTLGGSSAYGHPWGAHAAFTAILGEAVAASHPDRTVEAVNAAGVSYAIHRLGFVADEIMGYAPDILIVYSGHNEFAEPTFFAELKRRSPQRNRVEFLAAHSRIHAVMHDALLRPVDEGASPEARFDMFVRRNESHAYDTGQKSEVAERYRAELRRIVRLAHAHGIKVVLATVPANIARWRPNHSIVEGELDEAERARWAVALESGRGLLASGAFDRAVAELERAAAIAPRHAETRFLLAQAHEGLQQWGEALGHYRLAADHDASPIRRTSAINLAVKDVAEEEKALLVDVEAIFERESAHGLIEFDLIDDYVHPTKKGHRLIAWHLWNTIEQAGWLGSPATASREVFDRVTAPRSADTQAAHATWIYNQAYMLAHQGHTPRAIAKFREAVAIAPGFEPALSNLAQLLLAEGEEDEASRIVDELLRRYPENARGRVVRGMILARSGKDDEALAELRRAVAASPDAAFAHLHLGNQLLKLRRREEAKAAYARAVEIDPNNVDAKLGEARALGAAGDREASIARYRAVVAAHPSSSAAHHELGVLLGAEGNEAEAVRILEVAAALAPRSTASLLALGAIRLREREFDDAKRHFQAALGIDPDSGPAHKGLAHTMQATGEAQRAKEHLLEAVRIDPEDAEAHANLARGMSQAGEVASAVEHYRHAITLRPDWPTPRNNLAWILATDPDAGRGDREEAVKLATEAIRLLRQPNASALDTLAAAQAAASQFDQAAATASRALELALAAGSQQLAGEIRRRMELYARGEPYRAAPRR